MNYYEEIKKELVNNEYERLPQETKNKLITKEQSKVEDLIKNPILIKNIYNYEEISEKVLQRLMLEDISSFLEDFLKRFQNIRHCRTN